jgi:hypothetical protein
MNLPPNQARAKGPPPVAVPAGIDVELVALPPPSPAVPQKLLGLPLTRRDVAMFGIGVGMAVLGGLIGVGLAAMFGLIGKKEPKQEPEGDE